MKIIYCLPDRLFYFYKNISELLNYFIHNVQMNLLLSKFDNNYYLRSEYPFSMYSKTFFDDKNIFCKINLCTGCFLTFPVAIGGVMVI